MRISLILLVLILSCNIHQNSVSDFGSILFREIYNSYEIEVIDSVSLNSDKEIQGASMSWITLFRTSRLNSSMGKIEHVCLGYRLPFLNDKKSKLGILKIHKTILNTCPNLYSDDDEALYEISTLRFYFREDVLELNLLMGSIRGQKNIKIPLFNMDRKKNNIYFVAYGPEDKMSEISNRGLVSKVGFNPAKKCFDINKKCDILKKNTCEECLFGSYEVAGGSCQEGGVKYCNPINCGEKSMPACLRSKKNNNQDVCYARSSAGYCRPGLFTFCNPDGYLICL